MTKHLTILRIKNSDFDYAKYGLRNNYFSIDVTTSISYAKQVGVTQYAVLDGTTRLDNVSRKPASISLQGLLGEVRAGNDPEHFVYDTIEKNRLQNQMDLIEALRDQAIFIDFITDERTYPNYIINSASFGKNRFGQIDLNISAQEAILFGDDIDVTNTNTINNMTDYEQDIILNRFNMNSVNTDGELINEINRIIKSSILTTPFIILMGPVDSNPDVVVPTYSIIKQTTKATLPTIVNNSIIVGDVNYTTVKVEATELYTGTVAGGNFLHVTTPLIAKGTNLYNQTITKNSAEGYDYINNGIYDFHVRLINGQEAMYSFQNKELLTTPLYSDMVNGVHSLNTTGSIYDIISTAEYGINFVRKQRNNSYIIMPNLLGREDRGYLYEATFETISGNVSTIQPMLVYVHPKAWKVIKSELIKIWENSPYFKNKTLRGI